MSLVIKSDESIRKELKSKLIKIFQEIPSKEENFKSYNEVDAKLTEVANKAANKPPLTKPTYSVSLQTNFIKKVLLYFFL